MCDRRSAVSLLVASVVALGLLGGCGSTEVTPPPTFAPLVTPSPTPTSTASPSAAPVETSDPDDESVASETPAIGFTPGPSGQPAPTAAYARLPGEPDPALTPGSLNPSVTQATIGTTICTSGWTATIRPPSSYTDKLKTTQIGLYGYSDKSSASYEEDHLISLELGGNPTDPKNLWPEPYTVTLADGTETGAHVKDAFESKLKSQVCAGKLTLADAQAEIGDHWVHYYLSIP